MIDPISLMLLSQAIPTVINLGKSAVQGHKAKKLAETERPQYSIPEAVKQQVNQARYLASMRELPGQNVMENRIGSNLGKGISELKNVSANPADLASNVAKMYSNSNDAINDIGIKAGNQWLQNQGLLNQNLGMLGQYQDKQFDINKMQPYVNNMAASSALREGAFRNASAAGQNIASGISGYANMMYQQQLLDSLMGGNGGGSQMGIDVMGMGGNDQGSEAIIDTSSRGLDTAASDWSNQLTQGNYQNAPRTTSMAEAIQTPIIGSTNELVDPQGLSTENLIQFLLKDAVRNQSTNPYR